MFLKYCYYLIQNNIAYLQGVDSEKQMLNLLMRIQVISQLAMDMLILSQQPYFILLVRILRFPLLGNPVFFHV